MICWKCRETVKSPICVSCNTIQPLQGKQDYFRLLGLPRTYFLSLEEIAPSYRKSLRNIHPDRFVKKSAVERRMSLQWMAEINQAKRVISDPFFRALYLSTGKDSLDENSRNQTMNLDETFLEQIFDLQMMVTEDAQAALTEALSQKQMRENQLEEIFRAEVTSRCNPTDVARRAHGEQDERRAAVARARRNGVRQGLGCVDLEPGGRFVGSKGAFEVRSVWCAL